MGPVTGFADRAPGRVLGVALPPVLLLQAGWSAWAGTAAGAVFFLFTKRLAGPEEANLVYLAGGLRLCVAVLLVDDGSSGPD